MAGEKVALFDIHRAGAVLAFEVAFDVRDDEPEGPLHVEQCRSERLWSDDRPIAMVAEADEQLISKTVDVEQEVMVIVHGVCSGCMLF